jgi:hypothetical protein
MQVNRAELLAALTVVRAALVGRPYIQSLSHVLLDKGWVTAYNETIAITTWLDADVATIGACVPGDQLIAALGQFGASTIDAIFAEGGLTLSSGKARIKLAALPASDFLYEPSDWRDHFELPVTVIEGIGLALMGVGKDEAMPAALGVTVVSEGGMTTLYSTDNRTITRVETGDERSLLSLLTPGALLPTQFCEQLVTLAKSFPGHAPVMVLTATHAMVDFNGKVVLTTRLQSDYEVIDFTAKFDELCPVEAMTRAAPIPEGFDGAMARAALVLGSSKDPSVRVTIGRGEMDLDAQVTAGSSHDTLAFGDAAAPKIAFSVDPSLVMRGAKACTDLIVLERVLAMSGRKGALLHLVSHVSR